MDEFFGQERGVALNSGAVTKRWSKGMRSGSGRRLGTERLYGLQF